MMVMMVMIVIMVMLVKLLMMVMMVILVMKIMIVTIINIVIRVTSVTPSSGYDACGIVVAWLVCCCCIAATTSINIIRLAIQQQYNSKTTSKTTSRTTIHAASILWLNSLARQHSNSNSGQSLHRSDSSANATDQTQRWSI